MRHRIASKRLKRDSGELKSLLRNMSAQLFDRGSVTTTLSKAKLIRPFAEKMVTIARNTSFNSVKMAKAYLSNDIAVRNLFENVAPHFLTRAGGYTRIVKLGFRDGDNAPKARIEFVEDITKKADKKKEKVKGRPKLVKKDKEDAKNKI